MFDRSTKEDVLRVLQGASLVALHLPRSGKLPVHWYPHTATPSAAAAAPSRPHFSRPPSPGVAPEAPRPQPEAPRPQTEARAAANCEPVAPALAVAAAEPSALADATSSSPAADADTPAEVASVPQSGLRPEPAEGAAPLRPQRSVPTHPITRAVHFGGLGLGLAVGAAAASVRRAVSGEGGSAVMSEANVERLASTLCRLRGAAMKVGQMLSFNDAEVLPPELQQVMNRVRDGADYMPMHQLERTLTRELGDGWRDQLASFDSTPAAAASIGQVHRAVLADGRRVAIKVQYPGVGESIQSDLWSMKQLVLYTGLVPEGLFLDRVLKVAHDELLQECDYERERASTHTFKVMLAPYPEFAVPAVVPSLSSTRVLTTEWMEGLPIDRAAAEMTAAERNRVGGRLLWLSLMELFRFRFMQTDPNWSNFLYAPRTLQLSLIDFGACQAYDAHFADEYLRLVRACAEGHAQRDAIIHHSTQLGFLTGQESALMLEAHVNAAVLVGSPFAAGAQPFDFGAQNIARRVAADVSTMIKHRLTPPREEIYTLHRRLNGCFQLAARVGATIPARDILLSLHDTHEWAS